MGLVRLTEIDGSPGPECVAGLNWDTITKSDWKNQKKTAKESGIVYCEIPVTTGDTNTVNIGLAERTEFGETNERVSLAAWMAHAFKGETVVAVEKVVCTLNEESLWLCVIHNGQVISGTDIISDWDSIDAQVSEIIDMLAVTGDVGYVGNESENLTANTNSSTDPTPLIAILPKKGRGKALIRIPGKTNRKNVIALGIVGATSVIVLGGFLLMGMLTATDDTEKLRQARIAQVEKANEEYRNTISKVENTPRASAILASLFIQQLGIMKTQMGGWSLQDIICDSSQCLATFKNHDLTNPSVLREGLSKHCEDVSIAIAGIEGQCRFDLPEVKAAVGEPLDYQQTDSLRSGFMKFAQVFNGASYALEPAKEIPIRGKRDLRDKKIPAEGTWALAGSLKHLPQIVAFLDTSDGIGLSSINVKWQGKAIELSGPYYTKEETQ